MDIETIPFALPSLGKEEEAAVLRVLRSGWLTTGKEALAFEEEFARFISTYGSYTTGGTQNNASGPLYALAVNSATSGLHLALEALGIGPGDTVLLPSFTFTATAGVVRYLGAEPVLVDSRPGAFNMDCRQLELTIERLEQGLPAYERRKGRIKEAFGPAGKPRAVIPVHYGGLPCDMDDVLAIAGRHGLRVVEDAAHAFPACFTGGGMAGARGDAGVFSFYATKTITTGEGGMVLTPHKAIADRVSVMRSHGIDRSVWNRYTDTRSSWYYEVVEPGFKYNLPDLLAAIGRVQLTRARALLEKRRCIASAYDRAFGPEKSLLIPPSAPGDARHLYSLRLRAGMDRDSFIRGLREKGIGVSVHFIPLHMMPYYAKRQALLPGDFPEARKNYASCLSLPLWPGMGEERTSRVIAALIRTLREAGEP